MLPRRTTAKDFGMINFKEEQKEAPEQDKFYETFLPRRHHLESVAAIHGFDVEGERVFLCAA